MLRNWMIVAGVLGAGAPGVLGGEGHGLGEPARTGVDGIDVHYESAGAGETTIVCVHGWASDGRVWAGQFEGLTDRARLIAIDLPGHGLSDAPEIDYTCGLFVRAIAAVMDAEDLERAVLMGHSNGVPMIKAFEMAHPDRTSALIAVDGAMVRMFTREQAEPFLAQLSSDQYREIATGFLRGMLRDSFDEATKQDLERMMLSTPQHVMVEAMEATLADSVWEPDPIACPLLMVQAPNPMWSEEYVDSVRGLAPHVDYRTMDDVTHFLMMEEPAAFNEIVEDFLDNAGL